MNLDYFNTKTLFEAGTKFFEDLNIPINTFEDSAFKPEDVLHEKYNPKNLSHQLIEKIYVLGIVDDSAFKGKTNFDSYTEVQKLGGDYSGLVILAVELKTHNPLRSQLSEITRVLNRSFIATPVTVIYKYGNCIALANSERIPYAVRFKEGEKVGKVILLRDINLLNVHSGHLRILKNLEIERSGKNSVIDFKSLYKYWQDVLSVSILNKVFYKELSNWYFWAINEVRFPNEPNQLELGVDNKKFDEVLKEHRGKNVIRLLTRLLFIWFIKEKGLIPEEIFDEKEIAKHFIDGFTPEKPKGMFANGKYSSKYYRAILQNLFFATLNQPRGERQFRTDGKHMNATQLMRYKSYLKEPDYFIELMEGKVPFMNGGLFECLDKPHPTLKSSHGGDKIIYVDGFSDREDNDLIVPDFLFFDTDEELDLSKEYGNAKSKKEKTRGLFNILKSYKFTITENTPIDEEVALDPELLGKVFENLLASYNPETKTTARKQTGSFYTPREIVNYMVEESLIAYLKNELLNEEPGVVELGKDQIALFGNETKKGQLTLETKIDESPFKGNEVELEKKLHQLVSFSNVNPFDNMPEVQKKIIKALDTCKILDPACGSGAYPMGILQKMVHILHKIDPNNTEWKQRQIDRVNEAIDRLEYVEDAETKNKAIKELKAQIADIEAAFNNNELDYGRKLFLIENCIYGVDIQPIATQISKLRFFISLVVDQKVDPNKENFGVRPLPNLETKFVAANTLIGLPKQIMGSLFDKREVKKLEDELKKVRHKLFSVKTPSIKRELRAKDKELREEMQLALAEQLGNETAQLLAQWDPYDQNTSSPFFDKEWMFDISDGFDIVIGNPPYGVSIKDKYRKDVLKHLGKVPDFEIYYYFIEISKKLLKENGVKSFIIPNTFLFNVFASDYRIKLLNNWDIKIIDCTSFKIFEGATVFNAITIFINSKNNDYIEYKITKNVNNFEELVNNQNERVTKENIIKNNQNWCLIFKLEKTVLSLVLKIKENCKKLAELCPEISQGLIAYDKYKGQDEYTIKNRIFHYNSFADSKLKKWLWGSDVNRYIIKWNEQEWLDYCPQIANPRDPKYFKGERLLIREITNPSVYCGYTEEELYHDPANIVILKSDKFNIKVLMAILNSKLTTFYHFNSSPKATKGSFPKILVEDIKNFPLPSIDKIVDTDMSIKVDQILEGKKIGVDTSELEHQIDVMVYHLYNLSYEEACVIDESLTKEDFNKYSI
ncbi:Eco57I restriction-modification methylase domain-containing protein [Cloacibacterium caeni]|uniref:Eco57I restriction-modification methylase domain-containing protein n=1 Tax=Cloacibacterium caeni TaxID=2004710 RepID=UPI001BD0DC79|nr:TaqI-like C-terminal specificity domain-containing protein [Cloacibacterium caeni]